MQLEVVTPDSKVFEGEASSVRLPGKDGSFEVLDRHAAMICSLANGKMRIRKTDNTDLNYTIDGGVVEVLKNKVIVLAESIAE